MDIKQFNALVEGQFQKCKDVLIVKGDEYALDADRLAYFKKTAAFTGDTPEKALFGMLAKHLVSLADMCAQKEKRFTAERWQEKITDSMNYLALLWAMLNDQTTEDHNG